MQWHVANASKAALTDLLLPKQINCTCCAASSVSVNTLYGLTVVAAISGVDNPAVNPPASIKADSVFKEKDFTGTPV